MRGDEQELDTRCGTLGASGYVTTKPSIRKWGVLYKSSVYARKVLCLTPGGLYAVHGSGLSGEQSLLTGVQESAEGILGEETQTAGKACMDELGTRPAYRKSR